MTKMLFLLKKILINPIKPKIHKDHLKVNQPKTNLFKIKIFQLNQLFLKVINIREFVFF
jgi:hypothetical protein